MRGDEGGVTADAGTMVLVRTTKRTIANGVFAAAASAATAQTVRHTSMNSISRWDLVVQLTCVFRTPI